MKERRISSFRVLLGAAACVGGMCVVDAVRAQGPAPHLIYDHEVIRLERQLRGLDVPADDDGARSRANVRRRVSFDAFGKRFDLVLRQNHRLTDRLPRVKRRRIRWAARAFSGELDGVAGSWVRLTRHGTKVSGMIWDGAEAYIVDSSADVGHALMSRRRPRFDYTLVYRLSDLELAEAECGLDPSSRALHRYDRLVEHLRELAPAAQSAQAQASVQMDVAVVADREFVEANGAGAEAAVVARMNVVDGIFSEQVGVRLNLIQVQLLSSNGLLGSTSASTLLRDFGRYASTPAVDSSGIAHLFTGKDLDGRTAGIAYVGSLCLDRYGVGVSQVRGSGTAGALIVAHEMGHNFGAPHDNQSGSSCASTPGDFLMNPIINGSDEFSACSLDRIAPNVNGAACVYPVPQQEQADLRVSLAGSAPQGVAGVPFDVRVEVTNRGAGAATGASLRVELPVEIDAIGVQAERGSCSIGAGGVVDCDLGTVAAGAERLVTLSLEAARPGSYAADISVAADEEANPLDNTLAAAIEVSAPPVEPCCARPRPPVLRVPEATASPATPMPPGAANPRGLRALRSGLTVE